MVATVHRIVIVLPISDDDAAAYIPYSWAVITVSQPPMWAPCARRRSLGLAVVVKRDGERAMFAAPPPLVIP